MTRTPNTHRRGIRISLSVSTQTPSHPRRSGDDQNVLLDLLESSEGRIPRVQFWLDECVLEANPDLRHRLHCWLDATSIESKSSKRAGGSGWRSGEERCPHRGTHAEGLSRSRSGPPELRCLSSGVELYWTPSDLPPRLLIAEFVWIRIPTTTLAQADSGVGVKNSVNLFQKKNWIGTFAVPWGVINDRRLLETLGDRDFRCGFSEAIKVSLLKDESFFSTYLCQGRGNCRAGPPAGT